MNDWSKLADALKRQSAFSDLFFQSDQLTDKKKEELLKTFVLALHSEATGIVDAVNYKDHRRVNNPVDIQKILYKCVDAYRYILAMLNLWGIDSETFSNALQQKDDFLHYRHSLKDKVWDGQPIVLFDLDDVLAEFRESFCDYVTKDSGILIDPNSTEYYNVSAFKAHNLSNEYYFRTFMENHGFLGLSLNKKYNKLLRDLKEAGCWIQILTSRPSSNMTAYYDTYSWLKRHDIPADGVAFSPEKFVWLAEQSFYTKAKVIAVDDSAKHAAEYVKHGVPTVVPHKPYNTEVSSLKNIVYVLDNDDALPRALEIICK